MKWCGTWMVAIASIVVFAAPASAAEVVAGTDGTVTAQRGRVTTFALNVAATGRISCGVKRRDPARAVPDTQYLIVEGRNAPSGIPGAGLGFYSNDRLTGFINCGTTWDTHPQPYKVTSTLAVAPNTPVGNYEVPLTTRVSNPSLGGFGPLTNSQADVMKVRVVEPSRGLPNPQENRSVNLLPVRGNVFARYPRTNTTVAVRRPLQVPVNTRVDAIDGFVDLVSDRDSFGSRQQMTFWNGVFTVNYTRAVTPGSPTSHRSSLPITELTLARSCPRSSRAAAAAGVRDPAQTSRRRRKRRGVFGKGRGRFRTRGSYGAGTVRGTTWYSESRCSGTLFRVSSGVINVRDFSLNRNVTLRSGQAYIALPRNQRRGSSAG